MTGEPSACAVCGAGLAPNGVAIEGGCVCCRPNQPDASLAPMLVEINSLARVAFTKAFTTSLRPPRAAELANETVFTIRVRHPSPADPLWTASVEGPHAVFDIGMATSPDEALLQVIDTIALHDYDDGADDGGDLVTG